MDDCFVSLVLLIVSHPDKDIQESHDKIARLVF